MIGGKKIIGVCITKIHEIRNINLVDTLHSYAENNNSKLIVFNSYTDFYTGRKYDDGAKAIYDVINYDTIDVIVIYPMCFCDKNIPAQIIEQAKAHSVPVILIDDEQEGCYSVKVDYTNALKTVISHIINEHGVKDSIFISGYEGDALSEGRTDCYKEAVEENGLTFSRDNVYYGGFWQDPVYKIIDDFVSDGRKMPQAIFCANDSMAIATCERLQQHGYNIPADVIVTGFDGVPAADYFNPRLTTCCVNNDSIAKAVFEVVAEIDGGKAPFTAYADAFSARISESCGCEVVSSDSYRDDAIELFRTLEDMETLDDLMHTKTDRSLTVQDINSLYETVSTALNEGSYVCVSSDYLSISMGGKENLRLWEAQAMAVIPSKFDEVRGVPTPNYTVTDMVPDIENWVNDNSMYVLNSVFVRENPCGVYAVKVNPGNSMRYMRRSKRVFNAVNIAFNIASNYFRHTNMERRIEQVSLTNPTTGLPNLKGATKWFNEFSKDEKNHKGPLTVSVYYLSKYTYIYENYGIDEAEASLRYSAEALKLANPKDCFVAHIADDQFAVINYYENYNTIGDTINSATSMFYKTISAYNDTSGKDFYTELSAGCFVVDVGWNQSLETYLRAANNEMYLNILRQGGTAAAKEKSPDVGTYKMFDILIEKNLFTYCFQPIVSAKTGDIFAYEALMRTDSSIGMNPLEVLETAKSYRKLYQVEKATMFNVMKRVADDPESFADRKVFINTIPGNFLNEADRAELHDIYGEDMERYFFELTETSSVSDDDLRMLREFGKNTGQIAIDDFGAGHSNIVNLMRYTPQIIKIDRFLITDIHKNKNKQMFVSSTIDFAKMNGIKVLAEGVETYNEMSTVIDLGVDYIQGYYTGKPSAEPVKEIDPAIKKEIVFANPLFGQDRDSL